MKFVIGESQRKELLKESILSDLENTLYSLKDFGLKTLNDAKEMLNFDVRFLLTWSATIGGFMGPLTDFILSENPDLSREEVSTIAIGVCAFLFYNNKELGEKIYNTIKEKGLSDTFKSAMSKGNELKKAIKETGIKVSAHPSEYITLTSEDPKAINNSIRDLESHADIFDRLELPQSYEAPLNIHVRKDGNPDDIANRFFTNFNKLSDSIRKRLVLENNDNANGTWSIENLHHYYYKTSGIPITFDILHHKILPGNLTEEEAFNLAYDTWNTTPIFHYSEGKNNTRAHEHMAQFLPPTYKDVYWDVELKNKDYAILEMLEKCKTLLC
jgi:hypothetical protein